MLVVAFVDLACSLTTSVDGLAGGGADDGAVTDERRAEAEPPRDAALPDTERVDAPEQPFCATRDAMTFCEDFDTRSLPAGFDEVFVNPGVTAALDTTLWRSPPRAFHSVIPAGDAGAVRGFARKIWSDGARPVVVELDMYVRRPEVTAGYWGMVFVVLEYNPGVSYSLYINRDQVSVYTLPNTADGLGAPGPFPYDAWTHVRFEADPRTSGGSYRLFVGDPNTPRVQKTSVSTPLPSGGTSSIGIHVGLERFNPPTPELDVFYDNVTLERR